MSKKNIIVGQSGGPTSVINASLYGVINEGMKHPDEIGNIYGMLNGIYGLLNDKVVNLTEFSKTQNYKLLKTTPGAYLSSCRFKLPNDINDEIYERLFLQFKKYDIGYFVYIGGNDSMDTVYKLYNYENKNKTSGIKFIGIPKTIDNDLIITDHTPGFGSAAKYVATCVREILIDSHAYDNKKTLTIVEIMGRNAGWLTAASALSRKSLFNGIGNYNPLLIYLPEINFDLNKFENHINKAFKTYNNVVVCVSEGIHDKNGKFICEYDRKSCVDAFGHKQLSGTASALIDIISSKYPEVKMRSIELSVLQRAASKCLSLVDFNEAIASGEVGIRWALEDKSGIMVAFDRSDDSIYNISYIPVPVSEVCNREKKVPLEWICDDGSDVTIQMLDYLIPLIQGTVKVPQSNGLPAFAFRI